MNKLYTTNTDTDLQTFFSGLVLDQFAIFDELYNFPDYSAETIAIFNDLPTNEATKAE